MEVFKQLHQVNLVRMNQLVLNSKTEFLLELLYKHCICLGINCLIWVGLFYCHLRGFVSFKLLLPLLVLSLHVQHIESCVFCSWAHHLWTGVNLRLKHLFSTWVNHLATLLAHPRCCQEWNLVAWNVLPEITGRPRHHRLLGKRCTWFAWPPCDTASVLVIIVSTGIWPISFYIIVVPIKERALTLTSIQTLFSHYSLATFTDESSMGCLIGMFFL